MTARYLERRGLTGRSRYNRTQERAERVVLSFCALAIIAFAWAGWIQGGGA